MGRFALGAGADPTELCLATGEDWPDGIAAGSAIAVDEGVMLLVGGAIAEGPVTTWLEDVHPYLDTEGEDVGVGDVLENVRVLGGTEAVPAAVENPHYARDPGGPAAEPNEIHPMFAIGPGGTGEVCADLR